VKRRVSLRRILTRQFLLAAASPLLLFVAIWITVTLPDAVDDIERDNAQTAALLRSQIEAVLMVPQRSLEMAAALIADTAPQSALERTVMRQTLASAPSFQALYVADEHGVIRDAYTRPTGGLPSSGLIGLDFSTRPFYGLARERKGLVWSDTFLSPLTGQVTAVLAQPVGSRLLIADISLAGLAKEIAQRDRPREAIVVLLDGKGRAIVHPRQELATWQENLGEIPLIRTALGGHPGAGEIELGGERWLATVARIQPAGWYVLVAQRRTMLFAPLKRIGIVAGGTALLALALAGALAFRMAAREAERYRRLVAAAQAMVDDPRSDAEVELGSEETHALWLRLRTLLDRLQEQEQRARSAQRQLQSVLDAATEVAVVATDTSGIVRLFNRGAEKMLGYTSQEVVGVFSLSQWHDPDEVAVRARDLSARLNRQVTGAEVFNIVAREANYEVRDWTFVRRNGSRLLVSLAMTALHDEQGNVSGFLGVAVDQSQRQRAADLDLARERAEAASQAKSEFLSRVSHELRTPLNAMLGYAQLLMLDSDFSLGTEQRERVARIETAGWHLVRLIDDVLDLSRIESGRMTLTIEPVDVHGVLAEAVRLVSPYAADRALTIKAPVAATAPVPARSPMVMADRTRLSQVLVNLLSNAVKYNVEGGRVDVSFVERDGALLGIKVADTGRGMNDLQLERLFVPFDRLGLESTNIEGTGIGLVISKRLVELMNGSIEVQSAPRVGSNFTVVLPRAGNDPLSRSTAQPGRSVVDPTVAGDVVYVEDNEVNAILMSAVFTLRPSCRLHLTSTLLAGRQLIEEVVPRLVLIDMHLPDGSGLSMLEWLGAHERLKGVHAVIVSADATRSQQEAAARAGAHGYLTKPIQVAEALQVIDAILRTDPDQSSERLAGF
jgi:PAS domain S-box-containing protein